MWAKKQKNHDGLSASKISSFRVKFSLLIAEFSGDLCKQDCSLNGIAFIQIAPTFLMLSEFTPCPNPPQSTICNLKKTLDIKTSKLDPRTYLKCSTTSLPNQCYS